MQKKTLLGIIIVLICGIAMGVIAAVTYINSRSLGDDTSSDTPTTQPLPQSNHSPQISKEQAGTIATDKYGGEIISIEADATHDQPSWEVELKNSHKGRIEVDVDQSTGKVIAMEPDEDVDL